MRGNLDAAERAQIEAHVVHSYDFLVDIPWTDELSRIAEIVRGHHEKLDGTGYPDGVTGEQLSLETRIMTVCDIFDALTASDRPYKKALPVEKALDILREEAASGAVDSDIVELFIESGVYRRVLEKDWREL
ncbi:MAG: HD domain-containing protein [Thioalkalivibrio sp.]|nr:HD domain-containing protein [Thioalkalivibrio sp.]